MSASPPGKSSLVERFINAGFFDPYQKSTIGAAFAAKRIYLADGRGVTLGVWDTAGAERFEALSRVYYHSAKAALVCFDATAEYSWEKLHFWVQVRVMTYPSFVVKLVENLFAPRIIFFPYKWRFYCMVCSFRSFKSTSRPVRSTSSSRNVICGQTETQGRG